LADGQPGFSADVAFEYERLFGQMNYFTQWWRRPFTDSKACGTVGQLCVLSNAFSAQRSKRGYRICIDVDEQPFTPPAR
jgi:hypothetical protein